MLTERGGDEAELAIPPTIAALLSARLDRLGPGERAVITRAAVVGKEFSAEATVDLLPEDARAFGARHLEALVGKDLIAPDPTSGPVESFRFRHILIQQAAYRATPKSLRAELHERFAAWVERPRPRREPRAVGDRRLPPRAGVSLPSRARHRRRRGARARAPGRRPSRRRRSAGVPARRHAGDGEPARPRRRASRSKGEAGLAALPELGYALFEIGEVDEASAVLADAARATRARAGSPRGVARRDHTRAHRDVQGPGGDRPGRPRGGDRDRDRGARRARRRGRAGARMDGPLRPPLEQGTASRDERCGDPGGGPRAADRQSPRGRMGPGTDRPLRDPRPDAGRGGSELARAVARRASRRTAPWMRTCRGSSRCSRR